MKSSKTNLAIIGTAGVPAKYGGFETIAHHLVLNLNKTYKLTCYNSNEYYPKAERVKYWNGARIHYLPISANGKWSVIYDVLTMFHAAFRNDVLLILGVSGCLFLPILRFFFPKKKIMVNIDGLEWTRDKWGAKAKKFLSFSESMAVRYADSIISDNEAIQKYVMDRYGVHAELIEYGGDHCKAQAIDESFETQYPFLRSDYAFKVCRIEPENNVHIILDAFAQDHDLPLVMIGNWAKSEYGQQLKNQYHNHPNIHLLDPIYCPKSLNVLRSNATLYVHGHSAGGTNPSLVEAMALGLPILAFDVIYNKITTEHAAFYFHTSDDIRAQLKHLEKLPLQYSGIQMARIVSRRYTWSHIADKYSRLAKGQVNPVTPIFDFELPIKLQAAMAS